MDNEKVEPKRKPEAAKKILEVVPEESKCHVDFYLQARGVPVWERGGRRAFAIQHKMEIASDTQFDALFLKY